MMMLRGFKRRTNKRIFLLAFIFEDDITPESKVAVLKELQQSRWHGSPDPNENLMI
jgi:hypothetical protein